MENQKKSEFMKIFIVIAILVVLLLGILIVRFKKSPPDTANTTRNFGSNETQNPATPTPTMDESYMVGKFYLDPASVKVKTGEKFTLKINFSAIGKKADGADVVLDYNQSILSVDEVVVGEYFNLYPRKDTKTAGKIKINGLAPASDKPMDKEVNFATVTFTAKTSGTANISFEFGKGKTSLTSIVETKTSKNLLGKTEMAKVIVQ